MKSNFKRLIIGACIMLAVLPVFAVEEYVSKVYKEIDNAFLKKSDETLNVILQENQGDKYYFLMENYATKKVRRLIVTNDYDFAMNAILVIIDNNLDNTEAVEMYATISDAYELQKEYEYQEELKRQREQERLAALKEKQRGSAEREYLTTKTTSGETVFTTGKDGKISLNNWKFDVGVLPAFASNASDNFNSFLFGVALDFEYDRILTTLDIGVDVAGDFKFLNSPISETQDTSLYADFEILPKLGFRKMNKLFLRAGFTGIVAMKPNSHAVADVADTLFTPAVGLEFANIKLGAITFKAGFDYYFAHLWTEGLNTAMGFNANLCIPFNEMEKVRLNFNLGVKDVLFMKAGGIENRLNVIIALGAQNVNK